MLNEKFAQLYHQLYVATEEQALSTREEAIVGFATAVALNCEPCVEYYLERCQKAEISKKDLGHVLEKVMVVSSGQKRLLLDKIMSKNC